ncbi:MAG: universal stress protein [Methanotrichaceae archaeon]|nr:universal stress protein [Methanotrichaceae archaeon]
MFEKILVLTDFSPYARKFLEYIGDFPEVKDVAILNIAFKDPRVKVWDPAAKVKDIEKKLAKEKKLIKAPGVNVTVRAVSMMDGDIAMEIPKAIQTVASEENSQLVVMGARGKSIIQSMLLGSMTRNLLRFGDRHLLIMRYRIGNPSLAHITKGTSSEVPEALQGPEMLDKFGTSILSKVLIPTDFSQPAEAVISSIGSMNGLGEIVLLHVVSKGESKEEIDTAIKEATRKLNAISRKLKKGDMKVTPRVAVGSPVELMRSIADEEDVSMIAMSSVGEDAMRVGRIGSITYDVANTANRPVLIIRPRLVYNFSF